MRPSPPRHVRFCWHRCVRRAARVTVPAVATNCLPTRPPHVTMPAWRQSRRKPRPWPRTAMVDALLVSRCRRGFLPARTQKNRGPDPYDELIRCLIEIPSKSLHIHQTTKTTTNKPQALTVMKNYTIDCSKEASSKMFTFVYTPST